MLVSSTSYPTSIRTNMATQIQASVLHGVKDLRIVSAPTPADKDIKVL